MNENGACSVLQGLIIGVGEFGIVAEGVRLIVAKGVVYDRVVGVAVREFCSVTVGVSE